MLQPAVAVNKQWIDQFDESHSVDQAHGGNMRIDQSMCLCMKILKDSCIEQDHYKSPSRINGDILLLCLALYHTAYCLPSSISDVP